MTDTADTPANPETTEEAGLGLPPVPESLANQAKRLLSTVERLNLNVIESNTHIAESNNRIGESNKRIAELGDHVHRNRVLLRALAMSFVFDILLTGGLAWNQQKTHDASRAAARAASIATASAASAHALSVANRNAATATCISSNGVRANDIALWTHVLNLVAPKAQTAAQAQGEAQLLNFVDKTFAPKVCT